MTHTNLIDAAFHRGPIFRQGFSAHVDAWRSWVQEENWQLYWNNRAYRAAYDARRDAERAQTAKFFAHMPLRSAA